MAGTLDDIRTEVFALWTQAIVYFFITCMVYRYQIISARKHAIVHVGRTKDKIEKARTARKQQVSDNKGTQNAHSEETPK